MQLKDGVFRCIMQLYDCLLTEVHERCKKGLSLAKRLNSSLAFFCYDLLSIIEPRQVFELVCCFMRISFWRVSIYLDVFFLILGGFLHINYKMGYFLQWRTLFVERQWSHVNHKIPGRLQGR